MKRVGIKALKNNLSTYVREVEAGATVLVTDRDRVVAQLVPAAEPVQSRPMTQDEILDQLEREGLLTRAKVKMTGPPERMALATFDELMRGLEADREDR